MKLFSRVAVVSALFVAACGGGDGQFGPPPDDDAVPLSSEQDVIRELGNINDFVGIGDGEVPVGKAAAIGKVRMGKARVARLSRRTALAKTVETFGCDNTDGFVDVEDSSGTRSFEHFPVTRAVDITNSWYSNCRTDFEDGYDLYDGATEVGSSSDGYDYVLAGLDGDPFVTLSRYDSTSPSYYYQTAFRGLSEYRLAGGDDEARELFDIEFEDSDGRSGEVEVGRNADDTMVTIDGNGVFSIDGPYWYSTSECSGGEVRVETLNVITFSDQGYPDGGRLRFTSGGDSVLVTVSGTGGATIQFSNGGSASLTSAQMQDLYNSGGDC
ncbi:MAG: hypothetical protein WC809_03590 [Sinimarinibacterium sp.]|jgi:hypothetical protein